MRYFYFFVIVVSIVFLPNATLIGQPAITDFTPQSGSIGTSVTINGSGFLVGNTNNIVFFGAVKGQITNATTTAITVNVPLGATYKPITVVTGGLSASSNIPFNITFSTAPTFTATSFANKVDFASGNYPRNISIGDLDGDGKSDLASVNNNGNNVSIYRNNSTSGILSLLPPVFIPTNNGPFGENLTDIDGDGKLDLAVNCYSSSSFSIFRNTSSIGNISFATPVTLTANQNNYWIDFADFDNDGKPELISFNQNSNTYSVFKNTSVVGNISFANRVDFPLGFRPSGGCVGDFDNDGKIDFAVAGMDINVVGVARNTSNGTSISFAAVTSFATATQPFNVTAGDLDADGKKELIVPNSSSTSISIFKNTSNVGTITFAPKLDFGTSSGQPLYTSVNDLDGDGKIDIAVANFNANTVSVFKNQSTLGNIALAPNIQYATGSFCRSVPLGDMDGDGRPDIVTSNSLSNNISILRNTTNPIPCSNTISIFPYRERFETSNGNWIASGVANDWSWGAPAKQVITGAGEANKCWITGGLANASYSSNQKSYLQSPCFNFSTLIRPRISFKVFWELEKNADGAALQYSTDGGTSWNNVGGIDSNSPCFADNWYNNNSISSLNSTAAWSGNIQTNAAGCQVGNGSGSWLTSFHDLSGLAGQINVSFRFVFASDNACNSFEGFAIDDVNIFETPINSSDFTFTCQPSSSVNFNNLSSCTSTSAWNFGDPSSGSLNVSTSVNPSHIFSGAGSYSVTLNSTSSTGTIITTKTVTILDASISIANAITCPNTNTAVLNAVASGSNNPYTFLWNTTPTQTTQTISNIGAGSYSVTVSSANACSASASITLVNPSPVTINPSVTSKKCSALNGSIVANVSGGTAPYTYLWNNNFSTQNITGLDSGLYSVTVKDNNSCMVTLNNILVPYTNENISLSLGADATICPGQKLRLDAGSFLSYLWQDNSTSQFFDVTKTGNYKVVVKDINGCMGVDDINVVVDCSDIYFPTAFTPNGDNINDVFGPAGNNLSIMKAYKLKIYNRYGNLVFYSENPYKKWDGNYNGLKSPNGTFVYNVEFVANGKQVVKKGYVLLIR